MPAIEQGQVPAHRKAGVLKIERRLLQHAQRECANHLRKGNYGKKDYCLLEPAPDHRCLFAVSEDARCRYFEQSVLPLDAELQALYLADREARAHGDALTKERAKKVVAAGRAEATCTKCQKSYVRTSPRQLHCTACKVLAVREQNRARKRRQRGAVA